MLVLTLGWEIKRIRIQFSLTFDHGLFQAISGNQFYLLQIKGLGVDDLLSGM